MPKSCYTFEAYKSVSFVETNQSLLMSKTITFVSYDYPPVITQEQLPNGSYSICGPFLNLLKELSIKENSMLVRKTNFSID